MDSFGPHDIDPQLERAASTALQHAMALTMGQLQPRQTPDPAEPLPVAEVQEVEWEQWCAAAMAPVAAPSLSGKF